jgi:hypothetical protein
VTGERDKGPITVPANICSCRCPVHARTTAAGAADAFSRRFLGAAVMGAAFAVIAFLRMPTTKVSERGGHLHMH